MFSWNFQIQAHFNSENQFRLTIETNPNYKDLSPTTRCTPDIIKRSPLREQSKRKNIVFRAESEEIKKVWQNLISQSIFKINNSLSENNFRLVEHNQNVFLNPSTQTQTEVSSTKRETEVVLSPSRNCYNNTKSNHLNLITQNTIDLGESLETPQTPSCANLSLNEKVHNSLSFSSSTRNESCEGIFDFECNMFASEICSESMFIEDPFFVDET